MLKNIIMLLLTLTLALSLANDVYAVFWGCFKKGDFIDFCSTNTEDRTVSTDLYFICMSEFVDPPGCYIHASFNACNDLPIEVGCGNNGAGDTTIDSQPPKLKLINPNSSNKTVFKSASVELVFELDERAHVYYKDLNDPRDRFIRICNDCQGKINRFQRFSEGFNNIVFKAEDFIGNFALYPVGFFIDSRSPRISRTNPSRGFANGIFNVEFSEDNPVSLILTYGNSFRDKEVNLSKCAEDRGRTSCSVEANLTDFDGKEIQYWFNITDIAGNSDVSRPNSLDVDISRPEIHSAEYINDGRTNLIRLNITEPYFESASYYDNNDERARWSRLCSRLDDGICGGRVNLDDGLHNITVNVTDEAGNYQTATLAPFFTDSRDPRISRTNPSRGFADGNFHVEFDEENPVKLTLTYGNSFRDKEVNLSACRKSRRGKECNVFVNLSDFDGKEIQYWFNITDVVGNKDASRPTNLMVDISRPVINYIRHYADGRNAYFNISVNESNLDEISYIDSNDERARWSRLCSRVDNGFCQGRASLRDGLHNITINITDEAGNYKSQSMPLFYTDSRDPRITRTNPSRGFADGIFHAEIMEENPMQIYLNYGNLLTGYRSRLLDLDDSCFIERGRHQCNVFVNLEDYNGQEIEKWFNITDIVGNQDVSRKTTLNVDTTFPVINELNYSIDGRRVDFFINITEKNPDSIEYIDNSDFRPRWRRLCSRLDDGICERTAIFRDGNHSVDVQITDQAGNAAAQNIDFEII